MSTERRKGENFGDFLERRMAEAGPAEVRQRWPWLYERGGAIHMHVERDFRLSGRETRLTDDEVREDCAIFTVIGRDKIDAVEAFIRERFGT